MKIKVVVIDFEVPTRVKKWALRIGIPALVMGGFAALAHASVPVTFNTGDVLQASDLNADFQNLDQRLAAVEAAPKAPVVVDGNGVVLGRLLTYAGGAFGSVSSTDYTFLTSTGYVILLAGDGSNPVQGIYYSSTNCTGPAYAGPNQVLGTMTRANNAVYGMGQYYAPANPSANGLSTNVSFTPGSVFYNGACDMESSAPATTGFLLTPLTNAQVGLPATIASPLTVQ